jgi:hypothetical protein
MVLFRNLLLRVVYNLHSALAKRQWVRSIPCRALPLETCDCRRQSSVPFLPSVHLNSNATIIQIYFLVSCVTSEKQKEGETEYRLVPTLVMLDPCRTTHWKRHKAE